MINSEVLLTQKLLPVTREIVMFQRGNAAAHQAHETINVLERETFAFISPDLWSKQLGFEPGGLHKLARNAAMDLPNEIHDVDAPRQRLNGFMQSVVDDVIDE